MAISQQDYERLFGSNKNTSKTKDDYGLATSILAEIINYRRNNHEKWKEKS